MKQLEIGVLAAVAGGIVYPCIVYVAIKLNLKQAGRAMAHIEQDARFYVLWAILGAALGTMFSIAIPLLDTSGIKDPWYGLILIVLCMALFWPAIRFFKRR